MEFYFLFCQCGIKYVTSFQVSVHFLQLLRCHFELLLFNMVKIIPIGVTRIVGRFSYFFLLELQKENLQEKKTYNGLNLVTVVPGWL